MKKKWKGLLMLVASLSIITVITYKVQANEPVNTHKEQVNVAAEINNATMEPRAGVAIVLDVDSTASAKEINSMLGIEESQMSNANKSSEKQLVMAKVNESVNVRVEPVEEAEKTGKLYKDCGGYIVEQKDSWTKLKSGNVVGWVKDEYLYFGEEAQALASEVGNKIAYTQTEALRIRTSPSADASVYGYMAVNEEIDVIEEGSDWIAVEHEGNEGFIAAERVIVEFHIDEGETMTVIKERERKEQEKKAEQEKAKLVQNRGSVPAGATDVELLGALIQCEAGGESYEGQVAVGAAVMNRVRHPGYPNSITGVIYASGQFTPALNGKVESLLGRGGVKASCLQAASETINGASNIGGATRFRRAGSREGITIGNHVFW